MKLPSDNTETPVLPYLLPVYSHSQMHTPGFDVITGFYLMPAPGWAEGSSCTALVSLPVGSAGWESGRVQSGFECLEIPLVDRAELAT